MATTEIIKASFYHDETIVNVENIAVAKIPATMEKDLAKIAAPFLKDMPVLKRRPCCITITVSIEN